MARPTVIDVNPGFGQRLGSQLAEVGASMPSLDQLTGMLTGAFGERVLGLPPKQQQIERPEETFTPEAPVASGPPRVRETPTGFGPVAADAPRVGGLTVPEFGQLERASKRNEEKPVYEPLVDAGVAIRESTEGHRLTPYRDGRNGVATLNGVNLTVQDAKSLKALVGTGAVYDRLVKYVGKKYDELSPEDFRNLVVSQKEADEVHRHVVKHSLDVTDRYKGNLSDTGRVVLADIQHWTGLAGLRSTRHDKLGLDDPQGNRRNFVAEEILGGQASDAGLRDALLQTIALTTNSTTKSRLKKYLKLL